MEFSINFWAVLVAAISAFAVGSVWYSPILFGNVWMRENGFSEEEIKNSNPTKSYIIAFILTVIIAVNLAAFLGDATITWGLAAGALAGIGWVAAAIGILYLFEEKSFKLFLINAGYMAVIFILMGGIISLWQ